MSFRKRSEMIGGNPPPIRRIPDPRNPQSAVTRGPIPNPGRGPVPRGLPPQSSVASPVSVPPSAQAQATQILGKHPGIKPSVLTSQPTISTGSLDLDRILGHQGLPLGCSILIEENGTTDFTTVLAKKYAAEGVIQNRLDTPNTHVIVVGQDPSWAKTLPGLYKGSSRDQKKLKISENESKLSIHNINDQQQQTQKQQDLRIAWRYGLLDKDKKSKEEDLSLATHPDFIHQFDITTTLVPAPNPTEVSFIPITKSSLLARQIESIIAKHKTKIIRLIIPNLLHPLIYPLELTNPKEVLKIIIKLRSLNKKYANQLTILSSLNLDLYPRDNSLVTLMEQQFDCILELKPFDPALYELMERIYAKEPKKIKHGFLNIIKLPALSEIGMMLVKDMEYSFKNGKKNFDIEEWSIPVDEETGVDRLEDNSHGHDHSVEIGRDGNPAKGQTKKDIEF